MTKSEARNAATAGDSSWNEDRELVVREEAERNRVYDLEERTARFGEAIIDFAKTIPQNPITNGLISHCRKEARETNYFLRMVARAVPELKLQARGLWMEALVIPSSFVIRFSSF